MKKRKRMNVINRKIYWAVYTYRKNKLFKSGLNGFMGTFESFCSNTKTVRHEGSIYDNNDEKI